MTDFAGEGYYSSRMTMSGMGFNTIEEWSDWLAPRNIKYDEHAEVIRMDGTILEGGLYIDYHEAISPYIAKQLALEYYHLDKREKHFEPLEIPALNVDYCVAYMDALHFPTIVIQNGTIVVHASFYQTYTMALTEWACRIADSIAEN